jgi:hypothetical protein
MPPIGLAHIEDGSSQACSRAKAMALAAGYLAQKKCRQLFLPTGTGRHMVWMAQGCGFVGLPRTGLAPALAAAHPIKLLKAQTHLLSLEYLSSYLLSYLDSYLAVQQAAIKIGLSAGKTRVNFQHRYTVDSYK